MADSDAEWFTPDEKSRPTRRPPFITPVTRPPLIPTRRPTRRPRPPRTQRPPVAGGPYPGDSHDAADKAPSSSLSQAGLISITVVSCLVVVALVILLFYFLVLKKRLQKFQKKETTKVIRDDYSIRIEDVAHREIDESDDLYVNTQDLHRLASSLRNKQLQPLPAIPKAVEITPPRQPSLPMSPLQLQDHISKDKFKVPVATVNPISSQGIAPVAAVVRSAPPPPLKLSKDNKSSSEDKLIRTPEVATPSSPPQMSTRTRKTSPSKTLQKPTGAPPPIPKMPPKIASNKPSVDLSKKPKLPLLNVKLKPVKKPVAGRVDTPDTVVSFVMDDSDPGGGTEHLSLKARRTLLENALAKK